MPANPRLAAALDDLRKRQATGARVFASAEIERRRRELLVKHGFLQEVMKGWLISSSASARTGDTTPWYASYWEFCRRYCETRFGDAWHLSPEQSLLFHAENTAIPRQLVIYSPHANNDRIDLPHDTSFFALQVKAMARADDLELRAGMRIYNVHAALVRATPTFFAQHSIDARIALAAVRDPSGLLDHLLESRQAIVGGRLVGALRHVGNTDAADEILIAMKAADIEVRVTNPFDDDGSDSARRQPFRPSPPIVARLRELWERSRIHVIEACPEPPKPRPKRDVYLKRVDDIYTLDAYHSLSIEGYQVTSELVARVASGAWSPATSETDRQSADALAARGYWQAFQRVRTTAGTMVDTREVMLVRREYRDWYRELFAPHVAAGLLDTRLLAGHRNGPVYIRGSRHVPPRFEIVGDAMATLFDLIEAEPSPIVRAVLGHWLVGYIHPFPDGNGRIARFAMNTLLAAGGYPWTVIRVDERAAYLAALERASSESDIVPFANFIASSIRRAVVAAKTKPKKPPRAKPSK
jgi:hypothetical protein